MLKNVTLVLVLGSGAFTMTGQATAATDAAVTPAKVPAAVAVNYSKLPLSFAANQGQSDSQVKFTSRGNGYSLFLTDREAVLSLSRNADNRKAASLPKQDPGKAAVTPTLKSDVVRMQLAGANPRVKVSGEEKLEGTANYFIGNDPAKWHANVPTYSRVKYSGIYPGVDLVYYGGNQSHLEYDFVVAPGVDPKEIKVRFAGAKLRLNANGDLMVKGGNGEIAFQKPVVYQAKNGSPDEREPVKGEFILLASNTVGFSLGDYDKSRTVVIDPILAYSTYLGGSGGTDGPGYYTGDSLEAITVDASGNAYVTGNASSTDFPVTAGAFQTTNVEGAYLSIITKLNSTGTALEYSTYLGGTNGESYGTGIAVDASGNAYVTGSTWGTDFPVTSGAFQTTNHSSQAINGGTNGFITKLNSGGTGLVYSTYLGGTGYDGGSGIAVDTSGYAYVAGAASSKDFPVTAGAFQTVNKAPNDVYDNAFVTKLNTTGTALVYSTYLGGSKGTGDAAQGIAIDPSGNAYVAGQAGTTDFPITANSFQKVNHVGMYSGGDAFVTKLNAKGTALAYSTFLGGTSIEGSSDYATRVAVDASGHAYVTGNASSIDFPVTAGAFQTATKSPIGNGGGESAFVTKFNAAGTGLVYSTYLGGSGYSYGAGIAIDQQGNAYVTGNAGVNFPVTVGAFETVQTSTRQSAFLTKINLAGTALDYSTYLGGSGYDGGLGIAVDGAGNAYIDGNANSNDFPVTAGAFQTVNKGAAHESGVGFVAKFALGQPIAQFSTAIQNFPSVPLGSTNGAVENLTVTNVGGGTLNVTAAINSPNFAVLTDGQNSCPDGLTASQSCMFPVEFSPAGIGVHTDTLTLVPTTGMGASIVLRGTATGVGDASESPLNFGSIPWTSTKTLPLTIANFGVSGSPTVAVSFNNASYTLASGGTCTTTGVAAGKTCTLMIKFAPVGHGVHNAGITLTPSSGAASIVPVLGNAVAP